MLKFIRKDAKVRKFSINNKASLLGIEKSQFRLQKKLMWQH